MIDAFICYFKSLAVMAAASSMTLATGEAA